MFPKGLGSNHSQDERWRLQSFNSKNPRSFII